MGKSFLGKKNKKSLREMVDERNAMLADTDEYAAKNDGQQAVEGQIEGLLNGSEAIQDEYVKADEMHENVEGQDSLEAHYEESIAGSGTDYNMVSNDETEYSQETLGHVLPSDYHENDEYSYVESAEYTGENDESVDIIVHGYEHNFKGFLAEFFDVLGRWIKKNTATCVGLLVILIVVVVGSIFFMNKNNGNSVDTPSSNVVASTGDGAVSGDQAIQPVDEGLKEDAFPDVNDVIVKYFNAMRDADIDSYSVLRGGYIDSIETAKIKIKAQYVEDYLNIKCYTKNGPIDNSYVVYVKYDVKLKDWDLTAPSLLTVVLYPDGNNSLYVYSGDFDENIASYISEISSQDDVVDLITKVDAEYKEVLDSNIDFSEYMSALNQTIKNEVGELIAAETSGTEVADDTENPDENTNEQPPEEVAEEPEPEETTFEVKATTTVNVRMSDSEDADKLGKVQGGTVLVCNEQRPNGWSQVVYEGQTAYIKTEYLEKVSADGAVEANANTAEATGTVRVKETVNIRSQASTDGKQLGVAYMGESFPLVEKRSDGWSQIIYKDKEAYVKTEYLED